MGDRVDFGSGACALVCAANPLIFALRPFKSELDRMAIMLSRLGGRGFHVREAPSAYGVAEADLDFDRGRSQPVNAPKNHRASRE